MDELVTIQSFPTLEQTADITTVLAEYGIPFHLDNTRLVPANVLMQREIVEEVRVQVRRADLAHVRALLEEHAEATLADPPADYYLYTFTDQELLDILARPDEWSPNDYVWARRLLRTRGRGVPARETEIMRAHRTQQLARPHDASSKHLALGYALALLGGVIGIGIGWGLRASTVLLPDGRRVPQYSHESRRHGLFIMILGSVMLTLLWALRLLPQVRLLT
ncbi:hypothetical protein [Hymenobacter jejuensis]|uniref:DUF2007 domain-containing protein n=1 Tax=Hymenobacter jejuensis TaxID=2502781 RepID=A0A5B7ZYM9_9BACT|nr:hypothetical protein [Hymenobacter jejuensis]QDA59553.1 hypothetical protein FHG12_05275 [Hymenobacter jejuensis]